MYYVLRTIKLKVLLSENAPNSVFRHRTLIFSVRIEKKTNPGIKFEVYQVSYSGVWHQLQLKQYVRKQYSSVVD